MHIHTEHGRWLCRVITEYQKEHSPDADPTFSDDTELGVFLGTPDLTPELVRNIFDRLLADYQNLDNGELQGAGKRVLNIIAHEASQPELVWELAKQHSQVSNLMIANLARNKIFNQHNKVTEALLLDIFEYYKGRKSRISIAPYTLSTLSPWQLELYLTKVKDRPEYGWLAFEAFEATDPSRKLGLLLELPAGEFDNVLATWRPGYAEARTVYDSFVNRMCDGLDIEVGEIPFSYLAKVHTPEITEEQLGTLGGFLTTFAGV